jgi:PelA/Pel-15E family pectate lyase
MKVLLMLIILVGSLSGQNLKSILLHQRDSGGWPKNKDYEAKMDREKLRQEKGLNDSTFDNGATTSEMRILAKEFRKNGGKKYHEAFHMGLKFCLDAQYENGGWPQYFPKAKGYRAHVTFNDNAMIKVMDLLREVASEDEFSFVEESLRKRAGESVKKGVACILKCQIRVNGKLTVWCAQHDEETLKPAKARSYELPSFSGNESVGLVRFLMSIKEPSEEVKASVEGAVQWFRDHQITGYRLEKQKGNFPKGYDRELVKNADAEPLWARFYDLEEGLPIYCSRDGVPKRKLEEISYERRNGYSWVGTFAARLLKTDYPKWKKPARK